MKSLSLSLLLGGLACYPKKQTFQHVIEAHGGELAFYKLRDVSFTLQRVEELSGRDVTFSQNERLRFSDERCLSGKDCGRAFFLFSFPFKFSNPRYVFTFGPTQTIASNSYQDVRACFDHDCLNIYLDSNQHIAWMKAYDPEFGKVVWIHFTYDVIHGLWIPVTRTFFDGTPPNALLKLRTETLEQLNFWNGFTDEDFHEK